MVSTKAVRQAIYKKLNVKAVTDLLAEGSASICHSTAPTGAKYPLVIFQKQASHSDRAFTGGVYDNEVWFIKAICQGGSSSKAEDIDAQIRLALDWQNLEIAGGESMYLAREDGQDYTEIDSGEQFRHHGATYRLMIQ
jgi:hypothetical protein